MSADVKHEAGAGDRDAVRIPEPAPDMLGSYDPGARASGNGTAWPGSYDPGARASGNGTATHASSEPVLVDDVLDVDDATRLLRIGRNTVYELVARNEIPHRRLGKQIRFSRAAIMRWLDP